MFLGRSRILDFTLATSRGYGHGPRAEYFNFLNNFESGGPLGIFLASVGEGLRDGLEAGARRAD